MMAGSQYFVPTNWISEIFETGYPFDVWEERLRALAQGANLSIHVYSTTETLLGLVEQYVTVLTASLLNPGFRWMAMERFAPSPRIAKLASLLSTKGGWKSILEDPEFLSMVGVGEQASEPPDAQMFSIALGNPARRSQSGRIQTCYDPEWLIAMAESACLFGGGVRPCNDAYFVVG